MPKYTQNCKHGLNEICDECDMTSNMATLFEKETIEMFDEKSSPLSTKLLNNKTMFIKFPNKTAKEIVDECSNTLNGHKLLWDNERWEETNFAKTLDKAPEFDGHTPADVLERIKSL